MELLFQLALVIAAGLSVAIADMLIKKAGIASGNYGQAILQPIMGAVILLYAAQIMLFTYVFVRKWQLGIVAIVQMAVYAIACVLLGRVVFDERISVVRGLGMILAFSGIVLMNL